MSSPSFSLVLALLDIVIFLEWLGLGELSLREVGLIGHQYL